MLSQIKDDYFSRNKAFKRKKKTTFFNKEGVCDCNWSKIKKMKLIGKKRKELINLLDSTEVKMVI